VGFEIKTSTRNIWVSGFFGALLSKYLDFVDLTSLTGWVVAILISLGLLGLAEIIGDKIIK